MPRHIRDLIRDLKTQDNRATADPIFIVRHTERQYGFDPAFDGPVVWIDEECCEVSEEQAAELEKIWDENERDARLEMYTRTSYLDIIHNVQPFFTEVGAKAYIEQNRHRLKRDPHVYVETAYRNYEWQMIRQMLSVIKVDQPDNTNEGAPPMSSDGFLGLD